MKRTGSLLRWENLLIMLVTLAVTAVLAEMALRLTEYGEIAEPKMGYPQGYFSADPDLGVDHTANFAPQQFRFRGPGHEAFTNRFGCLDRANEVEDDYILVVGDSSTWGYAELESMWTSRLERALGRQILKCGVSGTGPEYQLLKAKKVIAQVGIQPQMILLLYNENDFADDVVFPGYAIVDGHRINNLRSVDLRNGVIERYTQQELEDRYRQYKDQNRGLWARASQRSVVLGLGRAVWLRFTNADAIDPETLGPKLTSRYAFSLFDVPEGEYPWLETAFEDHVANLLAFQEMAEQHEFKFVLLVANLTDRGGLRGRLRSILEQEIPCLYDVGEHVHESSQGRKTRYRFDAHWNSLGNRLAQEGIYDYLDTKGL